MDLTTTLDAFSGNGEASVFLDRFSSFAWETGIADRFSDGTVVALSGGADSVFLLLMLLSYRRKYRADFPLIAVHVHHGIRGGEADADAAFCRDLCESLQVPFVLKKTDVPALAKKAKKGLEETARNERYRVFDEVIAENNGFSYVVTAHHGSDHLETVVFHLMRGTGTRGLCGILPISGNRLHPLLPFSKDEITRFCLSHEIPFVFDSTNESDLYSRNYIRRHVVPALREITPDPERAVLRMSRNLALDAEYLDLEAQKITDRYSDLRIPKDVFLSLHPAVMTRVVLRMANALTVTVPEYDHLSAITFSAEKKEPFSQSLPGNILFVFDGRYAFCRSNDTVEPTDFAYSIKPDSWLKIEEYGYGFFLSYDENAVDVLLSSNVYKYATKKDLSSAILNDKLTVRSRCDGDAYRYGGMTHKVKKLLNDKKVSLPLRRVLPVLSDGNGVLWLPGFGVRDDGEMAGSGPYLFFGFRNPDIETLIRKA